MVNLKNISIKGKLLSSLLAFSLIAGCGDSKKKTSVYKIPVADENEIDYKGLVKLPKLIKHKDGYLIFKKDIGDKLKNYPKLLALYKEAKEMHQKELEAENNIDNNIKDINNKDIKNNIWHKILSKGGPISAVLVGLLFWSFYLISESRHRIKNASVNVKKFKNILLELKAKEDPKEAIAYLHTQIDIFKKSILKKENRRIINKVKKLIKRNSHLADHLDDTHVAAIQYLLYAFENISKTQKKHIDIEIENIKEYIENHYETEIKPALEDALEMLQHITDISTIIGLLGTILGIIFSIASNGHDPATIRAALGFALSTTAGGLTLFLFTKTPHFFLNRSLTKKVSYQVRLIEDKLKNIIEKVME